MEIINACSNEDMKIIIAASILMFLLGFLGGRFAVPWANR